jgi:serine protease Do
MKNTTVRFSLVFAALVILVLGVSWPVFAVDPNSSPIDSLRQMGKAFAKISEKASPAVVGIEAEKSVRQQEYPSMRESPFGGPIDPFDEDFFDYFFYGRPRQRRPQQQQKPRQSIRGSGFLISPDGYILTNNHVVKDAEKVTVRLGENTEFKAKVIGTDPDSDVAVIKIETSNQPYLEFADSDTLEVGEWVIAIGNPLGLSHTVTAGIVSAKGRSMQGRLARYEDFIQTDAAINFGNSGGPLLNLDGKAVGINTAIVSSTGGNVGIGLAIPINMAKNVYSQLVSKGTVERGFLGVVIQDLNGGLAKSFNLKETKGVLISEVAKGLAAEKAGIKAGDVVVEIDGQPVDRSNELQNRIGMKKPGAKIQMVVLRDGSRREFTVELAEKPAKEKVAIGKSQTMEDLGLTMQNLTDDLAERLGYEGLSGVVVTQVEAGSLAELSGISQGTLIMEVDRKPVKNTKEFSEAIEEAAKNGTILLLIRDEGYTRFAVITLPQKDK